MFAGYKRDLDDLIPATEKTEAELCDVLKRANAEGIDPVAVMLAAGRCAEVARIACMLQIHREIVREEMGKDE